MGSIVLSPSAADPVFNEISVLDAPSTYWRFSADFPGDWHYRWFVNGDEIRPGELPYLVNAALETRFLVPRIYEVQAVIDNSYDEASQDFLMLPSQLFPSRTVEIRVTSATGVESVIAPSSHFFREPFPDIVVMVCHL